jgi:hypothetical protein
MVIEYKKLSQAFLHDLERSEIEEFKTLYNLIKRCSSVHGEETCINFISATSVLYGSKRFYVSGGFHFVEESDILALMGSSFKRIPPLLS